MSFALTVNPRNIDADFDDSYEPPPPPPPETPAGLPNETLSANITIWAVGLYNWLKQILKHSIGSDHFTRRMDRCQRAFITMVRDGVR